jgi:predicted pyridoxine 5'-phosphate oxidase superfamily flavin-nucleotide-binding protein
MAETVKIPNEVKEFMPGKTAWVGTVSSDGMPNVTPKGTIRVLDDEHLVFADLFLKKTHENVLANPKVAVTVVDEKSAKGYQIKGTAEHIDSGPLYDQTVEELKKAPVELPVPKYVVKIKVESVFDQSAGPNAGNRIAP